jgi:hypothetical protein
VRPCLISPEELRRGVEAYGEGEKRDSVYRLTFRLVRESWGDFPAMVEALSVFLNSWNATFYVRFGSLDPDLLEQALREKWPLIEAFQGREIVTLSSEDEPAITEVFERLRNDLGIRVSNGQVRTAPVSAGKSMHMLVPTFFPIWDQKIAKRYGCEYSFQPARQYLKFMQIAQEQALALHGKVDCSKKTLLKQLDEYNYSLITKPWLETGATVRG